MAEIVAFKRSEPAGAGVAALRPSGILRLTLANPPANALSLAVMDGSAGRARRARATTRPSASS